MKKSKSKKLIISIKLDIECGKLFPIKKASPHWHTTFVIFTVSHSSFYLRLYLLADMEAFFFFGHGLSVLFFRTRAPCVPVEMVHTLLEEKVQSKWTHRLTPVTRTGKATLEGLEEVAKEVLGPYFHEGKEGVKVRFLSGSNLLACWNSSILVLYPTYDTPAQRSEPRSTYQSSCGYRGSEA